MNYRLNRDAVRDGDVLLFRGARGPVATAIRWGTRSDYSHAAIAVWVRGRLMVAESREFRGCRLVPLSRAVAGARVEWFTLDPRLEDDLERDKLVEVAFDHLGEPYGWASIARHAFARLPVLALAKSLGWLRAVPLLGRLVPSKAYSTDDGLRKDEHMVCSAYVARCYRKAGVDLVRNLSDRDTTPGDIGRSAVIAFRGELKQ